LENLLNHTLFKKIEQLNSKSLRSLKYTIVDIETTGLDPVNNEIIEIGALKLENLKIIDSFSALIKPKTNLPKKIVEITGITEEMLVDKPEIQDVLVDFENFLSDNIVIAHNSDFDIGFLQQNFSRHLNSNMKNKILCTLKISRVIIPNLPNYKLHTIAKYFNVPIIERHRALGDCKTTFYIWEKLVSILEQKGINTFDEINSLAKNSRFFASK